MESKFLICIGTFAWIIYRLFLFFKHKRKYKFEKKYLIQELLYFCMYIYVIALIGTTLFPIKLGHLDPYRVSINYVPFKMEYYSGDTRDFVINILGNLFILSPLSILLPILLKNKNL